MMSRFILEGFETDELHQAIVKDEAYLLIREMCHKFGLKVLTFVAAPTIKNDSNRKFQMCLPNGMAVAKVWAEIDSENKVTYYYRSPYYLKERGRSREDKETLHSTKLSTLIATLKRVGAIPGVLVMNDKKMKKLEDAINLVRDSLGTSYKSSEFNANEIHALLCAFLGETPNGSHLTIDTIKCQKVLDKYNEADRVLRRKEEEVKRFFYNPFYMIGADGYGHFIVGKVKIVGVQQYEIVESFKRYKSITECEDLIPVMTMTKLAYEGKQTLQNGYIPVYDKYDENLDAVFFYAEKATHYDYIWMATPCSV